MSLPVPGPRAISYAAVTATLTGMLTSTVLLSNLWHTPRGAGTTDTVLAEPVQAEPFWTPVVPPAPVQAAEHNTAAERRGGSRRAQATRTKRPVGAKTSTTMRWTERARAERARAERARAERARTERARTERARTERARTERASRSAARRLLPAKQTRLNRTARRNNTADRSSRSTRKQVRLSTSRTSVRPAVQRSSRTRSASRSPRRWPGGAAIPARISRLNWSALAGCESTGNPRAVNPSGRYHGLYQFDRTTWRSVGGSGRASAATPAEQTYRAQLLYLRRGGAGAWPVCGSRLFR